MLQPANVHALFVQLQTRYPTSALVTELVQIHDGLFVVRGLIQIGGTTIATGLAAAATVELAEDQARVRALTVLGVNTAAVEIPSLPSISNTNGFAALTQSNDTSWHGSQISSNQPDSPSLADLSTLDFRTPVSGLVSEPNLPNSALLTPDPSAINGFEPILEQPFESDRIDDGEEFLSEPIELDLDQPLPAPTPSRSQKPTKAGKAIAAPPQEDLDDLSTLIAHTDVEMDRIGWSKQEGRDYLKRTYGKSTRQRLDVDELMDFLNYLRALPTSEQ